MKKISHKNGNRFLYPLIISFAVIAAITSGCQKDATALSSDLKANPAESDASTSSGPGKKRFAINVDGDIREYYVHIPLGYNGSTALPVVFMLHGREVMV